MLKLPQNYTYIARKLENALLHSVQSTLIVQLNLNLLELSINAATWGFSFYKPEEQEKLIKENQNAIDIALYEDIKTQVIIFYF